MRQTILLAVAAITSQIGLAQTFTIIDAPVVAVGSELTSKKGASIGTRHLSLCYVYIDWRSSYKKLIKKNLETLGYNVTERRSEADFVVTSEVQLELKDAKSNEALFTGTSHTTFHDRRNGKTGVSVTQATRHDVKTWFKHEFPSCKEL